MSKYFGKDARLYIDGYDVSPITTALKPIRELEMAQYAVMDGVNGYHYLPGIGNDSITIDGLFDDNYTTVFNAARTATSGYQIMIPIGVTALNNALVCDAARMSKYSKDAVTTEILRIASEWKADNRPWDEAILLMAKTQKTGTAPETGTSSIIDLGSEATFDGAAYLQVFEQSGGTGCTVSVQHSQDNFVGYDLSLTSFTAVTGRTTERKALTAYDSTRTITEDLTAAETDVDVSGVDEPTAGEVIKIDNERMYVDSKVGNTLTVTRGYNGTDAVTHSSGAAVNICAIHRYIRYKWTFAGAGAATCTFALCLKRNSAI